jgi:hypothetical protein
MVLRPSVRVASVKTLGFDRPEALNKALVVSFVIFDEAYQKADLPILETGARCVQMLADEIFLPQLLVPVHGVPSLLVRCVNRPDIGVSGLVHSESITCEGGIPLQLFQKFGVSEALRSYRRCLDVASTSNGRMGISRSASEEDLRRHLPTQQCIRRIASCGKSLIAAAGSVGSS